jgi:hypothetical protein
LKPLQIGKFQNEIVLLKHSPGTPFLLSILDELIQANLTESDPDLWDIYTFNPNFSNTLILNNIHQYRGLDYSLFGKMANVISSTYMMGFY